ncbi:hypothetical protein P9X10_02220 [Bacillus cereus]|nr:hypothetical protein [Bacillus cereus]
MSVTANRRYVEKGVPHFELSSTHVYKKDMYQDFSDFVNGDFATKHETAKFLTKINGVLFEVKHGDSAEDIEKRYLEQEAKQKGKPYAVVVKVKDLHYDAERVVCEVDEDEVIPNKEIYRLGNFKYFRPIQYTPNIHILVDEDGMKNAEKCISVNINGRFVKLYGDLVFVQVDYKGDYRPLTEQAVIHLQTELRAMDFGKNPYKAS